MELAYRKALLKEHEIMAEIFRLKGLVDAARREEQNIVLIRRQVRDIVCGPKLR